MKAAATLHPSSSCSTRTPFRPHPTLACAPYAFRRDPILACAAYCIPFPQKLIAGLSRTFPCLEELIIEQEYDDASPELDFTHLSFPCLTSLELTHAPLATLEFNTRNTPQLKSLIVDQPVRETWGHSVSSFLVI